MCRLYGFHSTSPRKVECELIDSQNSLIAQSAIDEYGHSNPDGWGLVTYYDREPHVDRQLGPAFSSERFRWSAAQAYSTTVLAHVRKATVGKVTIENTHPFVYGKYAFVHNGTIGGFPQVKNRFIEEIGEVGSARIRGTTDSEHLFHLLLARIDRDGLSMAETLRDCCKLVRGWVTSVDAAAELALNVIWTDGEEMVGLRLGRSLWFVSRDEAHVCEICGTNHTDIQSDGRYRAVVLASERITRGEEWEVVQDGSIFRISSECEISLMTM